MRTWIRSFGVILVSIIGIVTILATTFTDELAESNPLKSPLTIIRNLDIKLFDVKEMYTSQENDKSKSIVLLAIDSESLHQIDEYPVPRHYWTTVINKLNDYGAKVIAFDIIFPESNTKRDDGLEDANEFIKAVTNFSQSLEKNVILSYAIKEYLPEEKGRGLLESAPPELLSSIIQSSRAPGCSSNKFGRYRVDKFNWTNPKFLEANTEHGYSTVEIDEDGILRNYKPYVLMNSEKLGRNTYIPSLGLSVYLSSLRLDQVKENIPIVTKSCQALLKIKNQKITLNAFFDTKLKWMSSANNFTVVPLHRLLKGENYEDVNLNEIFRNKTVFIGITAQGTHSLMRTPGGDSLPSVYAHLNFVQMLSSGNSFENLDDSVLASLIFLIIGILLAVFFLFIFKTTFKWMSLLVLVVFMFLIDIFYFASTGYQVQFVVCLLSIIVLVLGDLFLKKKAKG